MSAKSVKTSPCKTRHSIRKQPGITDSFGSMSKDTKGRGDRRLSVSATDDSSMTSIKELLIEMDKKWSKNYEDLKTTLSSRLDNIEKIVDKKMESLRSEINSTSKEVTNIKSTLSELETSMDYHVKNLEELESTQKESLKLEEQQLKSNEDRFTELEDELKKTKTELLRHQIHSRKFNLLFTGVPGKKRGENVYDTLRNHLIEKMNMDPGQVANIWIHTAHRLYSENPNKSTIIAKFVLFEDLQAILSQSRSLPTGMRVFTDLPVIMKKARSRLASKAYSLRHPEDGSQGVLTRITERDLTISLQTRKDRNSAWGTVEEEKFD